MDIYQTTYNYCTAKNIKESQKRLFEILPNGSIGKCSESNLVVFNHIAFTGGVQLNDLILRSSGYTGLLFEIPDFNFYKNRDNYSGPKKFISAHFLNGIDSIIHMNCDYFTMLRDPVSHILSVLTTKDDYFANSSNRIWDAVYSKLDFWEKEVGHINLQTFEIATDYVDKKFKSIPGTDETPIHFFKNYISTNPDSLLKIADEKIKEKYLMVGITELYEESIFLLFSRLHIKKTKLWRPGFFFLLEASKV